MYKNRVTIISQNESISGLIQKVLLENGLEVKTVESIEKMFDDFINLPHVLTIIDAESYGEDTLKIVCRNVWHIPAGYQLPRAADTRQTKKITRKVKKFFVDPLTNPDK